jgi:formylmethanofuran dehydrogenase subunit E
MLELGFKSHGYRCPGMLLELRLAWKAMENLGILRAKRGC